ncbi:MAG: hypothetical protein HY892_14320 [Deltaproteobacteria bacterium]|nr:hypothetical protein [Deltaproteobacteria bacterium]
MTVKDSLKYLADEIQGEWIEEQDGYRLKAVLAEQKGFLSRKKLVYQARLRIDEGERKIVLVERLQETGVGLSGGSEDPGSSPGFGFKKETYQVGADGGRSGSIEEQSRLFGKKYAYRFEFGAWREKIRQVAEASGFELSCRIW